eukprot:scaffold408_cov71-Cylindrotheca_fusiformis.AAC.35
MSGNKKAHTQSTRHQWHLKKVDERDISIAVFSDHDLPLLDDAGGSLLGMSWIWQSRDWKDSPFLDLSINEADFQKPQHHHHGARIHNDLAIFLYIATSAL